MTPPNDTCTMVYRRRIQKVIAGSQYWGKVNRIAVERHHHTAKAERIQNTKHWVSLFECRRTFATTEVNDLTLLKRKENANDCMTSTWQGPKKNTEPFFAANK